MLIWEMTIYKSDRVQAKGANTVRRHSPPRPGRVGKARVGARRDRTAHEDPSVSNSPLFLVETDFGLA
eukprot:1314263-Prymnesium_polylepis.1